MPQVDFYITEAAAPGAWLRLACRIAEKAYRADRRVLVWCPDEARLTELDQLLWTFSDRSFVPHEIAPDAAPGESPVILAGRTPPAEPPDVLINLDRAIPAFAHSASRVAEVIDGDPERRDAGRARFRAWRELGVSPATHQVKDPASL